MREKVISIDDALSVRARARAAGRKFVFTNGCFDVLHVGHVRYLQQARALGDVLLVGINSDDSVRQLKGPERPVNMESERAEMLAALGTVDYVTVFNDVSPRAIIARLLPDVLVKGGDYAPEDVVGGAEAAAWGGRVEIVPLLSGRSTTRLLQGSGARP